MTRFLSVFPTICFVLAAISVIADMRAIWEFVVFQGSSDLDVTRPFGFQAVLIIVKAIIQSLQWVAYGAVAELLSRQIRTTRMLIERGNGQQTPVEQAANA